MNGLNMQLFNLENKLEQYLDNINEYSELARDFILGEDIELDKIELLDNLESVPVIINNIKSILGKIYINKINS